jgi:hypothetical protein
MVTTLVAWLALAAPGQAAPNDVSFMNEREFQIPITLPADPAFQAEIDQLFLWVSTDEGRTWKQEAVASPKDKNFPFRANRDGSYWFNVSVQDKKKQSYPADVSAAPPALKVLIDTKKPLVKLVAAEQMGDQVNVAWELRDENLDLGSFRLEYATADAPNWVVMPVQQPTLAGQRRWTVATPGTVMVRVQVQDAAGNVGMAQQEVTKEGAAAVLSAQGNQPPMMPPHRSPQVAADQAFPAPNYQRNMEPPAPPRMPEPPATTKVVSYAPNNPPAEEAVMPRVIAKGSSAPAGGAFAPPTTAPTATTMPPAAPKEPAKPRNPGPATQYTNQPHIELNYEAKAGPSGVGEVQLWVTMDDGKSWSHFADDSDLEPPFAVELPGEGAYGFALIIKSKGGLYRGGKQAPEPGEVPEMRLEVDTTPPEAVLYSVEAEPRRKDTLFLQWNVTDRNLTPKPITIKWSEKLGGPWQDLALEIPNTGRHEWQMPPSLPYRVYLRLEAKDLAGNLSIAETPEPVLVDLTEPEGALTGISFKK